MPHTRVLSNKSPHDNEANATYTENLEFTQHPAARHDQEAFSFVERNNYNESPESRDLTKLPTIS